MTASRMIVVFFALVVLGLSGSPILGQPGQKKEQSWVGRKWYPSSETLIQEEPVESYLARQMAWEKLWYAWRPDDELPAVDITKQLVLVLAVRCPNNTSVWLEPQRDPKGNLTIKKVIIPLKFGRWHRPGRGFNYHILVVPREGVLFINGKALEPVKK